MIMQGIPTYIILQELVKEINSKNHSYNALAIWFLPGRHSELFINPSYPTVYNNRGHLSRTHTNETSKLRKEKQRRQEWDHNYPALSVRARFTSSRHVMRCIVLMCISPSSLVTAPFMHIGMP